MKPKMATALAMVMCLESVRYECPRLPRSSCLFYSPSSLVESPGRPRPGNRDGAGNQIRRARENERDLLVEAQCLNRRREKILEAVCSEVRVLDDDEEPDLGVFGSFDDALPAGGLASVADGVPHRTLVREGALFRGQPVRRERFVREDEEGDDGKYEGNCALEDEQPPPARDPALSDASVGELHKRDDSISQRSSHSGLHSLTIPSILKMPRAIKPANAVARILPVYRIEILVASSFRV